MEYKIEYMYKGMKQDVILSNCENILNAIYNFYDAHGVCEIVKIELTLGF